MNQRGVEAMKERARKRAIKKCLINAMGKQTKVRVTKKEKEKRESLINRHLQIK